MSSSTDPPELGWAQSPTRHLLNLSWPICLSTISYAVYTIADTWFVSHLGNEALASTSLGGVLCFSIIWFSRGILSSVKLKVSQDRGADANSDADIWILPGLRLAVLLSLVGALALVGVAFGAVFLTETKAAGLGARDYILLRGSGILFCLLAACLREALLGQSESRIPLWGTLAGTMANIALDALFVMYWSWGVQGAAIATALAYGADLGVLLYFARRRRKRLGLAPLISPRLRTSVAWDKTQNEPEAKALSTLWTLGWPIGVANFLEIGAFAVLTSIVAKVGNRDLAAHQIVLQLLHFAFLPVLAIGEGASIMVSEAYGAGRREWMGKMAWRTQLVVSCFGVLVMLTIWGFAEPVARAFAHEPALIELVLKLFGIAAFFQISDGLNIVGRCVLRGIQDIRFVSFITISLTWGVTCPLAYVLVNYLEWGAEGAWWAILVEVSLVALILWGRLLLRARRFQAE